MTRTRLGIAIGLVALVALSVWVVRNTYWEEVTVFSPPSGDAVRNPFYATQRFVEALGAQASWEHTSTPPPLRSVLVLTSWNWGLTASRRRALEQWVESGGRLVVDHTLLGDESFRRWSGVSRIRRRTAAQDRTTEDEDCRPVQVTKSDLDAVIEGVTTYAMCDIIGPFQLQAQRPTTWMVGGDDDHQAVRVEIGQGRVTVLNTLVFTNYHIFRGDHGALFVAAAQVRAGDDLRFLTEGTYPSILALVWTYGSPVVILATVLLVLALWRQMVRFGPLVAAEATSRRSLVEQILGTGQFALRHGDRDALFEATRRALEEAAGRRIAGFRLLTNAERARVIAQRTALGAEALEAAMFEPAERTRARLSSTIALLETARRLTVAAHTRPQDGSHGITHG